MAKKEDAKPLSHVLVPKHEKLSEKDKKALCEKYHITINELPKISIRDPALRHLEVEEGDFIRITRSSRTSGTAVYYRGVIRA